jgi:Kdo2-lipid IVA lauroyltransferase/acyltransferase
MSLAQPIRSELFGSVRKCALWRHMAQLAEAAALVAALTAFRCLPVDWASNFGGALARAFGPWVGASRHALRNLQRTFPENTDAENHRILLGMWENLGRGFAEYPHLAWICAEKSGRVEIVNGDVLTGLVSDGRAGLLFGGHFANWEVGSVVVHRLMGSALLSVYRAPNNPWTARVLQRFLPRRHAIPKGADGGRAVLRHLRNGGLVGMLADQKLNDGIAVAFMGRDAMTAPALARLSLRFRCSIRPVRIERLRGARFRFTVQPPIALSDSGNAAADVLAIMTRVNAAIESWVCARPEHWLWLHRRWPT